MDYSTVFKRSGKLIWRHKSLWVVGLLLLSASIPGLVVNHVYLRNVISFPSQLFESVGPGTGPDPFSFIAQNPGLLIGGALIIFLVSSIVWLLTTIGEAALIQGVADYKDGKSPSLRAMFATGTGLLARFIAIDTVVFFPLFLIFLVQLLTIGGGLIAAILFLSQPGANPDDIVPVALIIGFVLIFLTLLTIPVTIISLLIRLIAFRSAALEDLSTRPSIRRAWHLIRAKVGEIIIVFLLLYAVGYVFGMVASLLIIPFAIGGFLFFIPTITAGQFPQQGSIDAFLLIMAFASLISLFPAMLNRLFYSAVWTLSYREWQNES